MIPLLRISIKGAGTVRALPIAVFAVGLFLCPLLLPGASGEEPALGDPLRGIQLFAEKGCVSCHTVWGAGGETFGPDLAQGARSNSLHQLIGHLWSHSPKMAEIMTARGIPRPSLDAGEMADIIAYLYFLNFFDPPGDAELGRLSFDKMGCSSCHQVGGRGGLEGPPLDRYASKMSPVFIAAEMWNHGRLMSLATKELGVGMPSFAGREIADILAYIRSVSTETGTERHYMIPGNAREGKKIFQDKGCSDCHAVWGEGGKMAGDLGKLHSARSVSEIAGLMWNHFSEMSAALRLQGREQITLEPEEMNHLLIYIYFTNFINEPGDREQGRILFDKKNCSMCHSLDPAKETVGGNLALSGASSSAMMMASRMWQHAPIMLSVINKRGLDWPRFSGNEMRDMMAFLRDRYEAVAEQP